MGLLGDLYSTIDSKKRQLRGLLSDPLETLYQGVRNFGAEHQGLLDLQARAYPWTGNDRTAAPDLMARKALADAGAAQGMAAATVWHGSPHKFDKFDSSKIGTGEGAQAYGHGLYLAESPSVAKSYADTLSQYHIGTRDGMKSGGDFADALVANAGDYPASLSSAIRSQANKVATDLAGGKTAEQVIASMRNGPYARMYAGLADAVEKMSPTKAGGSLYKVDLPDEAIAKMLDWDLPLSQQAPKVNSALQLVERNRLKDIAKQKINARAALVQNGGDTGPLDRQIELLIEEINSKDIPFGGTGESYYKSLRNKFGTQEQAANYLKEMGIQGIRYLDGGSRGAGQGTSNFVVFPGNEGLLSILERNGKSIK